MKEEEFQQLQSEVKELGAAIRGIQADYAQLLTELKKLEQRVVDIKKQIEGISEFLESIDQ
jgi:septal ring factor EnvC (AmiA/AmiB activator)